MSVDISTLKEFFRQMPRSSILSVKDWPEDADEFETSRHVISNMWKLQEMAEIAM